MLTRAWKACLELTLKIDAADRVVAAQVYSTYKAPILKSIPGSRSRELHVRDHDVQMSQCRQTLFSASGSFSTRRDGCRVASPRLAIRVCGV